MEKTYKVVRYYRDSFVEEPVGESLSQQEAEDLLRGKSSKGFHQTRGPWSTKAIPFLLLTEKGSV